MNNHATGSIWQTSRIKLEQQLWAQIAADLHGGSADRLPVRSAREWLFCRVAEPTRAR
jgi:hypothetical protein